MKSIHQVKCMSFKKPYPLYYKTRDNKIIRVCQDCGFLETCHGPNKQSNWRHIILHPDYNNLTI